MTDLGPSDQVTVAFTGASTRGLDAGWELGPEGTLFYTFYNANSIGQRPGGLSGTETVFQLSPVGVEISVGGLTFSPFLADPGTGFGVMQVSTYPGRNIFNVPLTPLGGGLFQPGPAESFVSLPQFGTGGIQYIPSGPLAGNLLYVNWDFGEIRILLIDQATGLPIDDGTGLPMLGTDNPQVLPLASGLGIGPWGLEFDSLTNDAFVSTWAGNPTNTIIQIGGLSPPTPEELIEDLIDVVTNLGLPSGIENSLVEKLNNALAILQDNNPNNDHAATLLLEAFVNEVEAQSGNHIPQADAGALIAAALEIVAQLNDE